MSAKLPLAGITVISLEQAVAAPFATRQLADLGARVIKIERASGDFARGYDTKVAGMASCFVWLNRGKESIVLDLKSPQGLQILPPTVAGTESMAGCGFPRRAVAQPDPSGDGPECCLPHG